MAEFDFHMRVAAKDPEGYYHVRWDQATPLVVRATDRPAAFQQAWTAMGAAPRGRTWTAQIDRVAQAPECLKCAANTLPAAPTEEPTPVPDPTPDCDLCPHSWDEHNGMGDCLHPDARTTTGYCRGHNRRGEA